MTWDPRDLGPAKPRPQAASPEPPAPPPRSYELQLADWDDRRLTAERAGLTFREPLPEPSCEEDEPLCAAAIEQVLQRDIFNMPYGMPKVGVTAGALSECMTASVDRLCPPSPSWITHSPAGSFKVVAAPPSDQGFFHVAPGRKASDMMHAPIGAEIKQNGEPLGTVLGVERTPDGGARVRFRLGSAKPMNDAMLQYLKESGYHKPIDHGDMSPATIDANHRALVERPAQTLRDRADAIQYGLTPVFPGEPINYEKDEDGYRGADAD